MLPDSHRWISFIKLVIASILVGISLPGFLLYAEPFTPEQLEWLESDSEHPVEHVNEGALVFLPLSENIEYVHESTLRMGDETIATGWARLDSVSFQSGCCSSSGHRL